MDARTGVVQVIAFTKKVIVNNRNMIFQQQQGRLPDAITKRGAVQ